VCNATRSSGVWFQPPSSTWANISIVRYNATVNSTQRLGSLLVDPGGPGLSGVTFVQKGAGSAISTLSGGFYDIIGFDPRGFGKTIPLLECFSSASAEYNYSNSVPSGPNLWLGMFSNSSYDNTFHTAIADFCVANSSNCPLAVPSAGITATLKERLDFLFENLFLDPIQQDGQSISLDIFNPFLWYFLRAPVAWALLANIIQGLEARNGTLLLDFLQLEELTYPYPMNPNVPGVGTLSQFPLQCIANAPSSNITLQDVIDLTKHVSIKENTPLLSAGLTSITFCRHFPDTRPQIITAGASLMEAVDEILSASNTTILIVNADHDPATSLISAKVLRGLLPNSSKLAIRGGSGHTTPSMASLSLAQTIQNFFVVGTNPADNLYHNTDQEVFPAGSGSDPLAPPVFNGTAYTESQMSLLLATYRIIIAFAATETPGQRNLQLEN
jgi:pimeloyl-ACP methyl ester carboxylesterase